MGFEPTVHLQSIWGVSPKLNLQSQALISNSLWGISSWISVAAQAPLFPKQHCPSDSPMSIMGAILLVTLAQIFEASGQLQSFSNEVGRTVHFPPMLSLKLNPCTFLLPHAPPLQTRSPQCPLLPGLWSLPAVVHPR